MLVRLLQFEGGNTRLVEVTLAAESPARRSSPSESSDCPGAPPSSRSSARATSSCPDRTPMLDTGDEVLLLASAAIDDDEIRDLLAPGS